MNQRESVEVLGVRAIFSSISRTGRQITQVQLSTYSLHMTDDTIRSKFTSQFSAYSLQKDENEQQLFVQFRDKTGYGAGIRLLMELKRTQYSAHA